VAFRLQLAIVEIGRSRRCRRRVGLPALLAGLTLLAASGCQKAATLPEIYPVRGKVVFEGGQPLPGGIVTFQSQNEPAVSTSGVIGPDGTFLLHSFKAGIRAPGAVAGPHRVVVNFSSSSVSQFEYPEPLVVKPGDNEFTLTIPKSLR
jgi:hypothetical protein